MKATVSRASRTKLTPTSVSPTSFWRTWFPLIAVVRSTSRRNVDEFSLRSLRQSKNCNSGLALLIRYGGNESSFFTTQFDRSSYTLPPPQENNSFLKDRRASVSCGRSKRKK